MEYIIFYSWQSDLPPQTNEQFIEQALTNVVQKLKGNPSLDANPILDRDIANVPGSPEIARTILTKIERSDIFVGDVSIINKRQFLNNAKTKKIRPTPNPNVLVELGYALKTLKSEKIILVNNLAFGEHEDLPFDFRHRYVVGYTLAQNDLEEKRETERRTLEDQLEQKLLEIIFNLKKKPSYEPSLCDEAISAIKNAQPNQVALISDCIDWVLDKLEECSPPFPKIEGNALDSIIKSIDQTEDLIIDFIRLFSVLVKFSSTELPRFYIDFFERIIVQYNYPIGFEGPFSNARMRFYQFMGHELFITLVALLFEVDELEILAKILDETLYIENDLYIGAHNVSYTYISMVGESSGETSQSTIDFLAEKLNQRHSEGGELAKLMPMKKIVEADFFLSLCQGRERWIPIIDRYSYQQPKFLVKASKQEYAQMLLKPLAVNNVEEFRGLFSMESKKMFRYRWVFNFDPSKIASE